MSGVERDRSRGSEGHPFRSDPRTAIERAPDARATRGVARIVWTITPGRAKLMTAAGLGWAGALVVLQDHPWAVAMLATLVAMLLCVWISFRGRIERN